MSETEQPIVSPHVSSIEIEMVHVEGMAPPNLVWHQNFAMGMQQIGQIADWLRETSKQPADWDEEKYGLWDCGDLGDYVDMLSTLLSFRPHTDINIENAVRETLKEDA